MDTTQLTFLLYLFLGQAVLLGLWALVRRRAPADAAAPGRLLRIGFAVYLLLGQVALFVAWLQLRDAWESAGAVAKADVVVILHFGFVVFVLGLQVLVLVGWPLGWAWTRNFWLRLLHIVCIEIVVGQTAIVGLDCPLSSLEIDLRGSLRPHDPLDTELGFSGILAGNLVSSRSESFLTSLVMATGCATTKPPTEGGTPFVGWTKYYVANLHYLEGSSPVARFCHEMLFYQIPERYYKYVVAPFGLLMLLTWIFLPPRMPGQRLSRKQELAKGEHG